MSFPPYICYSGTSQSTLCIYPHITTSTTNTQSLLVLCNLVKKQTKEVIMTLGELKEYISSFPNGYHFEYTLSKPFSWRGIYSEVCFSITLKKSSKEEILMRVNEALTETFKGYKGGTFTYDERTKINFEESESQYTGGGFEKKLLVFFLFN